MPLPQDSLDMSLADLIAKSKQHRHNASAQARQPGGQISHFRGQGPSSGPARRPMNLNAARTAPYCTLPRMQWGGAVVEQQTVVNEQMNKEGGTKLYISNLNYDVTNRDIQLLFSDVGELERYSIHYDKSGRSKGTAEVVFVHHSDAVSAMQQYNNKRLDGKQLDIKLVGVDVVAPVPVSPNTNLLQEKRSNVFQRLEGGGSRALLHGRGGIGLVRGRGQVRYGGDPARSHNWNQVTAVSHPKKNVIAESFQKNKNVTFKDLDAELDKYHNLKQASAVSHPRKKVTCEDLDADLDKYNLEAKQMFLRKRKRS